MATADIYGLVGQVLDGQFRVDRAIGEGGFSVVYRGQHIGLDEPVAIKCLKLQHQLGSAVVEGFIRRFRDESKIHYRLSRGSLHIARTIAAGTTMAPAMGALVPYMVLEWLEGFTLAEELRARRHRNEKGRTLQEVIRLLDPVAEAMAFAHAQGVVHRDLNPSNIFVAHALGTSKLKVLDFGVAKVISDHALALGPRVATMGQIRMFTPAYAAPEQFHEALGPISAQTDVYSFAVMVVELLADRAPIEGDHIGEYADRALDPSRRPTPRSMGVVVGDAAEAVITRAVTVDPSQRPSDVGEFWGMLKNAATRDAQHRRPSGAPGFPKSPGTAAPSARDIQMPMPRTTSGRLPAPEPHLSAPPRVDGEGEPAGAEPAAGRYFYSSRPSPAPDEGEPRPPQPSQEVLEIFPALLAVPPELGAPAPGEHPFAQTRASAAAAPREEPRAGPEPTRKATLMQGSPGPRILPPEGLPSSQLILPLITSPSDPPPFAATLATPVRNPTPPSPGQPYRAPTANNERAADAGSHMGDTAASPAAQRAAGGFTASPGGFNAPGGFSAPGGFNASPAAFNTVLAPSPERPAWQSTPPDPGASRAPRAEKRQRSTKAKSRVPLLVAIALALTVTLVIVAIVANQLAH